MTTQKKKKNILKLRFDKTMFPSLTHDRNIMIKIEEQNHFLILCKPTIIMLMKNAGRHIFHEELVCVNTLPILSVSSNPVHDNVYSIKQYVIKLVNSLR
jgi:hypothetical protein